MHLKTDQRLQTKSHEIQRTFLKSQNAWRGEWGVSIIILYVHELLKPFYIVNISILKVLENVLTPIPLIIYTILHLTIHML